MKTLHHVNTSLVVHQNGQFPVFGLHKFQKCTSSTASKLITNLILGMKIGLEVERERYVELKNFLEGSLNLKLKMAPKKFWLGLAASCL